MYLHMEGSIFSLAMGASYSSTLRFFGDLLLRKDRALPSLTTRAEFDLARVLFVEIREHFHGDGLGLPRAQLDRMSRRVSRLFDLHFSDTRVLRRIFFALKAQVIEQRTHLSGGELSGRAVSFASLPGSGPAGALVAGAVHLLGEEGVSMLDVLEIISQRSDEQASDVVAAEGPAAKDFMLRHLFPAVSAGERAPTLVATYPCALDGHEGALFVTSQFLAFAPSVGLRFSWARDPSAAGDERQVIAWDAVKSMDRETVNADDSVILALDGEKRHVLGRFPQGQRDVFLSSVWAAVSGSGTRVERFMSISVSAGEARVNVLPAGEAVLRSYQCAKVTADKMRRKAGTLYVCFRHLVFDSEECSRKTLPYGDIAKVVVEHSAVHGPTVTLKAPSYHKKRLALAGFVSRQEANDLVAVISGLLDVYRGGG